MVIIKKNQITSVFSYTEKSDPLYPVVGVPNSTATLGNTLAVPQMVKQSYHYDYSATPRYIPKRNVMSTKTHIENHSIFHTAKGKNPNVPSTNE